MKIFGRLMDYTGKSDFMSQVLNALKLLSLDSVTRRADGRNQWHGGTTLLAGNDDRGGDRCADGVCRTAIEKKVRKEEDNDFFCYLCSSFIHDKPSINHQT